jgi:branched-chain amino acid aminotransferase
MSCGIWRKIPIFALFMIECIQPYYLLDGQLCDCASFRMEMINAGKSIYEVIRIVGNRFLFLEDHLDRIFRSMELEGMVPWIGRKEMEEQLKRLIRENPPNDGNIKFVMNFQSPGNRHFLAYFVAHRYPSDEDYRSGVRVITFPFERPDPNRKVWRPAFRSEVAEAMRKNQAFEALLIDSGGYLPEASRANVFAVTEKGLVTSPDEFILPGITRKYVLQTCLRSGIPVEHRKIHMEELGKLDGMFLTGTSLHVLPVCRVDDLALPVVNGSLRKIMKEFERTIRNHLK